MLSFDSIVTSKVAVSKASQCAGFSLVNLICAWYYVTPGGLTNGQRYIYSHFIQSSNIYDTLIVVSFPLFLSEKEKRTLAGCVSYLAGFKALSPGIQHGMLRCHSWAPLGHTPGPEVRAQQRDSAL